MLVIRCFFITAALWLHCDVVPWAVFMANRGVKAFEDHVSEFTLHEGLINIGEDTRWFRLNNTNVMYASGTDSDNFLVHQWFNKFRGLADGLDAVVIGGVKRGRGHKRCDHCDVLIIRSFLMIVAVVLRRRASGVAAFRQEAQLLIHICNSRECYFLEWVSAFSVKFIHELAELATSICPETVKMSAVWQALCVSLTAADLNNFFIGQGLDTCRVWLIGFVFVVFWEISNFIETKLPKTGFAPSVDESLFCQCHAVWITASELNDKLILKRLNFFWHWHKGTPVDVKWHLKNVTEPELSARSTSKAVYFATFSKNHCVNIAAGCMSELIRF